VVEAPSTPRPLRELLVMLRQVAEQTEELDSVRGSAPAEFARLRLRAILKALTG
jgi:hypothetical protein